MATDFDLQMMTAALQEARKCVSKPGAFCVGCVLVSRFPNEAPVILSTGFSRELPGNTHAEANALTKALRITEEDLRKLFPDVVHVAIDDVLRNTCCYTTMEPCSIRTSGLSPCADALIDAHIPRCIIGVGEPDDFVKCEGASRLANAGVEVIWLKGLEDKCLEVARTGHA